MSSETIEDTDSVIERKRISIDNLILDTAQSRQEKFGPGAENQRLVDSIATHGIMQALIVRPVEAASYDTEPEDSEYAIIAGSRRYHAAVEAGLREVPCRIIHADDLEAAILSYRENVERKDLTRSERAESLKMQYELLAPDTPDEGEPWVCPDCGNEYDTSRGLHQHITKSDDHATEPFGTGQNATTLEQYTASDDDAAPSGMRQKAVTPQQAYKKLADEHFSGISRTGDAVRKVKSLIALASLPTGVRGLFKQPDERTKRQRAVLNNFTISSDCTIALKHAPTVREFQSELRQMEHEMKDAPTAVLRAVSEFDSQSANELGATLREVKDRLSEETTESDTENEDEQSPEGEAEEQEQEPDEVTDTDESEDDDAEADGDEDTESTDEQLTTESFHETLEEQQEQGDDEQSESADTGRSRRVSATVRFENDRHKQLHERAKAELRADSDTEIVRRAHQEYLEQLAEKHEWDVPTDSEDE
jgi:hypothetical protein